MNANKYKAIRCTISRGGFSDERLFVFAIGDTKYSGIASRRHMWTSDSHPLEDGEPPLGKEIDGFVAARIISILPNQQATVSIPDGEVVTIPISSLVERPSQVGKHVPIGS